MRIWYDGNRWCGMMEQTFFVTFIFNLHPIRASRAQNQPIRAQQHIWWWRQSNVTCSWLAEKQMFDWWKIDRGNDAEDCFHIQKNLTLKCCRTFISLSIYIYIYIPCLAERRKSFFNYILWYKPLKLISFLTRRTCVCKSDSSPTWWCK